MWKSFSKLPMTNLLKNIKLLSQNKIENKRVLLRVDFNVPLTDDLQITDDVRIVKSIQTMQLLLKNNNKIILVSHLGRPQGRDEKLSLKPVADYLKKTFTQNSITLVTDFLTQSQTPNDITLLENIRYYEGEDKNDDAFAKQLASIADVYINDAFGVSHRNAASIVGITKFLPSYCGLLLEKEITAVTKIMDNPKRPLVAIIGGAKISTKIVLLEKLLDIVDYLLLGGGIANTFLQNQQPEITQKILNLAKEKNVLLLLPIDKVGIEDKILDIGPKTEKLFSETIKKANTIIWNGPVGLIEDKRFTKGTQSIFTAITQNDHAFSLVGGGDTLASVSGNKDIDKITHVSTGGGAMLELIEKGTLPGIEALKQKK
ncbi:MAG: phosphoglycerate kinase [Candidatus Levyibacteriota bacterium]|nr:MAG: phosphoglycerate kinase [Candidatus Levybacteria bacterium]